MVRLSRNIVYILDAKCLAKRVRQSCALCQQIRAKLSNIVLAPLHTNRLVIAPNCGQIGSAQKAVESNWLFQLTEDRCYTCCLSGKMGSQLLILLPRWVT